VPCVASPEQCGGGTCWPCRYSVASDRIRALEAERDALRAAATKLHAMVCDAAPAGWVRRKDLRSANAFVDAVKPVLDEVEAALAGCLLGRFR
jgi:hypothetical protein